MVAFTDGQESYKFRAGRLVDQRACLYLVGLTDKTWRGLYLISDRLTDANLTGASSWSVDVVGQ